MTETHDPDTGEIISAGMPPAIAAALCKVMKAAKQLGYDSANTHASYKYVSADKFFAIFGPAMADAGLLIIMDEDTVEIAGAPGKDGKVSSWLKTRYKFTFAHESGVVYGPVFRTVMVLANGAQAFGSAQTYLLKQFLRATFLVPTGDRDEVDDQPHAEIPASPKQQPAQAPQQTQAAAPSSGTVPNAGDLDYARSAFTAIRQQIAQATDTDDVDAVMKANEKQLGDIKRIAGEPHWQKLLDSAKARKDMLSPEVEPVP
jgi:hypothetical protein